MTLRPLILRLLDRLFPPPLSRIDRIRAKIMAKVYFDPITGCWIWTGPTSGAGRGGGYGRVSIDGGTMATHKVMWICEHGPIPPRKELDHGCPVPKGHVPDRRCCNPNHLDLVTHKRNQLLRDLRRKQGLPTEEIAA